MTFRTRRRPSFGQANKGRPHASGFFLAKIAKPAKKPAARLVVDVLCVLGALGERLFAASGRDFNDLQPTA